ncbi:hypothetical protein JW960_19995 [candidate division KSB1 bacterium]|nr:hypothetical protein [candidate division KSB1 bacterium]
MKKSLIQVCVLCLLSSNYTLLFAAEPSGILGYYQTDRAIFPGKVPVIFIKPRNSYYIRRIYARSISKTDSGFVATKGTKNPYYREDPKFYPFHRIIGVIDSSHKLLFGEIPHYTVVQFPRLRIHIKRIDSPDASLIELTAKSNNMFETSLSPGTYRFDKFYLDGTTRPLPIGDNLREFRFRVIEGNTTTIGDLIFTTDESHNWLVRHKTYSADDTIAITDDDIRRAMHFHFIKRLGIIGFSTIFGALGTNYMLHSAFDLGHGDSYGVDSFFRGAWLGTWMTSFVLLDLSKVEAWKIAHRRLRLRYAGSQFTDDSNIRPQLLVKTGMNYSFIDDPDLVQLPGAVVAVNRVWELSKYFCSSTEIAVTNRRFILRDKVTFHDSWGLRDRISVEDIHYNVNFIDIALAPGIFYRINNTSTLRFTIGLSNSVAIVDHSRIDEKKNIELDENQPAGDVDFYFSNYSHTNILFNYDFTLQYLFKHLVLETHFKKADHESRVLVNRYYSKKHHSIGFLIGYAF